MSKLANITWCSIDSQRLKYRTFIGPLKKRPVLGTCRRENQSVHVEVLDVLKRFNTFEYVLKRFGIHTIVFCFEGCFKPNDL